MDRPVSVKRQLVRMSAYNENVVADFTFSADFRSTIETLAVTLSVNTDKTKSIRAIEQMADKAFLDLLKATVAKGSEEISS